MRCRALSWCRMRRWRRAIPSSPRRSTSMETAWTTTRTSSRAPAPTPRRPQPTMTATTRAATRRRGGARAPIPCGARSPRRATTSRRWSTRTSRATLPPMRRRCPSPTPTSISGACACSTSSSRGMPGRSRPIPPMSRRGRRATSWSSVAAGISGSCLTCATRTARPSSSTTWASPVARRITSPTRSACRRPRITASMPLRYPPKS